jgi:hypothetical protein
MPTLDSEAQSLTADDFEFQDEENGESTSRSHPAPRSSQLPSRSQYHLPASEQLKGVANRIIFSRYYIGFYFIMMSLSLTTVVLSLIATSKSNHHVFPKARHVCLETIRAVCQNVLLSSHSRRSVPSAVLAYPGGHNQLHDGAGGLNPLDSLRQGRSSRLDQCVMG